MIQVQDFQNRVVKRAGRLGQDACVIMEAAIQSVDPYYGVACTIQQTPAGISIAGEMIADEQIDRVFLLGVGKASVPMAKAALDLLDERIQLAYVITKDPQFLSESGYAGKLWVDLGGHPVPTENSLKSTKGMLAALPQLSERDLVLVMISGGGSALFTDPMGDISLEDLQILTEIMLKSGAQIQEVNTIRKHIDGVKGGRLAERLFPARIHALILSDVVGDPLDMIASGPTVPDPTTFQDAWEILQKYDILEQAPHSVRHLLAEGSSGNVPETLKPGDLAERQVGNHLIGTNYIAARAAHEKALQLGYHSLILTTHLTGLTSDVAQFLSGILKTEMAYQWPLPRPFCLILGGETTVHVTGNGLGGRNQDLVMRMGPVLADMENVLFISLATDGEDGPTDAAGAASDALVYREASELLGMDLTASIKDSNAYAYLNNAAALIKTGATGTNVNDLVLILGGY